MQGLGCVCECDSNMPTERILSASGLALVGAAEGVCMGAVGACR